MKGTCHCGQVGFELASELEEVYVCNCSDCKILSGSSHHLLGIVERGAININLEELTRYQNKTESGHEMSRYFCPNCGTPIFVESTRFRDIQMVLVSTVDKPEVMTPSFEIWCKSKCGWQDDLCKIRRFERGALD